MRSSAGSDDTGQAVVELALALPLVCLLSLGTVQVGLVVRDQLAVQHAAREAARAAAVSAAPVAAARRATAALHLEAPGVDVHTTSSTVRVTVRARSRTDVPLIGLLVPDATLESTVVMALEPP